MKKSFLLNFPPTKHEWRNLRRYWMKFSFTFLIYDHIDLLKIIMRGNSSFPFMVKFYSIFLIKSDKPDGEIRFLILWRPHINMSFLLLIYEKIVFSFQSSMKYKYLSKAVIQKFICGPSIINKMIFFYKKKMLVQCCGAG